jgi:hypothetical protein
VSRLGAAGGGDPGTPASQASTSSTRSPYLRTTRCSPSTTWSSAPNAGLSKDAAIRMAISTARNALACIDGKLDASMVVNREVL